MAPNRSRSRTACPEGVEAVPAPPGPESPSSAAPASAPPEEPGFRRKCHPACIACREEAQGGLGLAFEPDGKAGVRGVFRCQAEYQGYPDRLHGGVIALAIDAAMTQCLFFQRVQAVTARLEIRYRRPVRLGSDVELKARIVSRRGNAYRLTAEARQNRSLCALASAIFMDLGGSPST